jgi:hypothetical protein
LTQMRLMCLLFLAASAYSQTVLYLRYGAGPKITVTGASNTTPIQITTATAHGFSPGDVVWIWGVDGNWNADGTRIVKAVQDATHFTITYMNGNDAVGNGTFSAATRIGAWCGSTVAYPITQNPVLWFDGPSGQITAKMKYNAGLPPRAQTGFAPWDAITSWLDTNIGTNWIWNGSNYGLIRSGSFGGVSAMALRWFSDNTQTNYRDGAVSWLDNIERFGETTACDESVTSCGDTTNMDYTTGYFAIHGAITYTLLHDQLSSQQRTNFLNQILNDRTDGATCTNQYQTGSGIVTAATSGSGTGTMTGSGTNWLSTLQPGYVINAGNLGPKTIVSVDSDTQLTYRITGVSGDTGLSFTGKSYSYKYAAPWQSSNCGIVFFGKHSGYSPLSPGGAYPPSGGTAISDLFGNQFLTKTAAFLAYGLVTANDDSRGVRLAEGAANWFQDVGFPLYQKYWTGPTQIDSQYGPDRFGEFITAIVWGLYNATGGAVNYLSDRWLKDRLMLNLYQILPTSTPTAIRNVAYGTSNLAQSNWSKTLDQVTMPTMTAGSPEASYMGYFRANVRGDFTASLIQQGACIACGYAYAFSDPSDPATDYRTQINTARAFIYRNAAGVAACPTCNTDMVISRTGFSDPNDTLLFINAVDEERASNHLSNSSTGSWDPGNYYIYKHHYLIAGDSGTGLQDANGYSNVWDQKTNYFEVGGTANLKNANGTTVIGDVEVTRYADGGNGTNKSKYMYALVDASGAYTAAANIARMNRHFVDFKGGSQQYIVIYDDVATTAGEILRSYTHFPNNGQTGEGTTTYSQATNSAVSLDSSGGARLNTAWLFPGPPGFTYTDNPDGTYAGGGGQTFRVSACIGSGTDASGCSPSATSAEILTVHQPSMNQSLAMPALTLLSASNFRVLQISDPTSPKVAAFAQGGALYNSVSFVTTFSGTAQYLVAGLSPGSYNVTVNGSAVLSGVSVASGDNTLYWEGGPGAVSIVSGTASCAISSSSLPPATTGIAYSQTVQTSNCVSPVSWSVTAGNLPSGLTLNPSTGVIGGTPASSGEFVFTLQVTDSNSSSDSRQFAIIVNLPSLTITTGSLPDGARGVNYSQTVSASGGTAPYSWDIVDGSLPDGLTLNSSTGAISGTPVTSGLFSVTIRVTDANSLQTARTFQVGIHGATGISFRGSFPR